MTMDILRTESLHLVRDGALKHQIDAELVKIHHDCQERPLLKKPRKVTVEIIITPDGQTPDLQDVDVAFTVKASIPPTEIRRPMKAMKKRNGFAFDADTDDVDHDPAQRRLQGIDEDGDES